MSIYVSEKEIEPTTLGGGFGWLDINGHIYVVLEITDCFIKAKALDSSNDSFVREFSRPANERP